MVKFGLLTLGLGTLRRCEAKKELKTFFPGTSSAAEKLFLLEKIAFRYLGKLILLFALGNLNKRNHLKKRN